MFCSDAPNRAMLAVFGIENTEDTDESMIWTIHYAVITIDLGHVLRISEVGIVWIVTILTLGMTHNRVIFQEEAIRTSP